MFQLISEIIGRILCFFLYFENNGSFPKPLSAKEEYKCFEEFNVNGDNDAKNKLIEHNLRLVAHIVKKYYSASSDQEDLISIGTIGLIKAVTTFSYKKGTRFATYASKCIENEILMHFRSIKKSANDVFISDPIDTDSEGNTLTLGDIIYEDFDIIESIDTDLKIKKLMLYIEDELDSREKQIIFLRFGLGESLPLTQREVALKLGISRSYVSRIEKKSLEKLKKKFNRDN